MSEEALSLEDSKIVIVTPMEQGATVNNASVTTVASVTIKKKSTPNRSNQTYWKWCTVLASIAALVGGFTVVLAFSHIFVVPHLETEDFVQTDCYIRQIDFHAVERGCSPTDCHTSACRPLPVDHARTQPLLYDLCAKVKVRYYSLEGRLELAVLNPELQTDNSKNITHKCGCGFFDIQPRNNQSEILSESSEDEGLLDSNVKDEHLTVVAAGRVLQTQSKTRCYYRRKNGQHQRSLPNSNRHLVLQAILWPTVVFVLGFVGLFFSCLTLQKEKYGKKKPLKACVV